MTQPETTGYCCKECCFWRRNAGTSGRGECRIHPPALTPTGNRPWPPTNESDWCGFFKSNAPLQLDPMWQAATEWTTKLADRIVEKWDREEQEKKR